MGVCESSFDLADRKSSYEFMRNCSYVIVPLGQLGHSLGDMVGF